MVRVVGVSVNFGTFRIYAATHSLLLLISMKTAQMLPFYLPNRSQIGTVHVLESLYSIYLPGTYCILYSLRIVARGTDEGAV